MKMERKTEQELIDLARRDWYKKMNEALAKEMQRLREENKKIIEYGFE